MDRRFLGSAWSSGRAAKRENSIGAGELPGGFHYDPADQIIVASARITGATLMTRDRRILTYAGAGHLNAVAA
jgi:PIN domain nuclease of toxin-antitoxin system